MQRETVGIVVICYNKYGRFFPQFMQSVHRQGITPDIITVVAMGNDHDLIHVDSPLKINIIKTEKVYSMGEARNIGIRATHTDRILYFSIDDVLLNNAIEQILDQNTDVVFLRLSPQTINVQKIILPTKKNIRNWRKMFLVPGYICFKRKVWEKNNYLDSEYPNLPFIFMAVRDGFTFSETNTHVAKYLKRPDGHSAIISKNDSRKGIVKFVNRYAKQCSK